MVEVVVVVAMEDPRQKKAEKYRPAFVSGERGWCCSLLEAARDDDGADTYGSKTRLFSNVSFYDAFLYSCSF